MLYRVLFKMTCFTFSNKSCRLGHRPNSRSSTDTRPSILIAGVGNLAHHVINQLLSQDATSRIILAGRDHEILVRRANLVRFAAANLGRMCEIDVVEVDLWDISRTAESLAACAPDIIFMSASLQPLRQLMKLPKLAFEMLGKAQFGPWLPMGVVAVF